MVKASASLGAAKPVVGTGTDYTIGSPFSVQKPRSKPAGKPRAGKPAGKSAGGRANLVNRPGSLNPSRSKCLIR
ncbi:hypothetical protein C5615_10585 [Burkholderia cepacia]|uniref:Uncharacterized protein n=1 Tax=Burkholderia cepacia TaxID=292 RepID=A0A2S8IXE7_BURCE|nr:hypothetical protein C5615_10585 [Burkholderia cepacia]